MAFYNIAGWKFWTAVVVEYFLVTLGFIWDNSYMVMGGMLLGVVLFPYMVHIAVKDNGINKVNGINKRKK